MAASHARANTPADTSDRELVVTRVFDAPRDLAFSAWTDPAHLVHWWGPDGFTLTIHEMDVKPGGVWRFVMHGPDGRNYNNRIVYVEVARPERLVYKHVPEPGDEPVRFDVTVTFEEQDGKTHLTMQMVFPSKVARDHIVKTYGAEEGAKQTLGRLAAYVTEMLRRN
jgi:uncharacterized protein YndB with AHSA1/START domain